MFEMATGEPFNWDDFALGEPGKYANPFFDEHNNPIRDTRLYETLFVNGDRFRGRTLEIYKGGREQCDGYSDEPLTTVTVCANS